MCVECCCWADTERCPQSKGPSSNEVSLPRDSCGGKPAAVYHVVEGITALGEEGKYTAVRWCGRV